MDAAPQVPLILISGGSRGVGAATARLAAAQGYDVAISFVSNESAVLVVAADVEAAGCRALPVRADGADPAQVAQLFAAIDREFGRIDMVVNNASILARQSRLEDLEFERMQRISVNSIGLNLCAQQAVKCMSYRHNNRGGVIVNISSASARLGSLNEYVDYASSKGAVETFTTGFAKEVARDEIRVNCVRPGHIYRETHASGGEPGRVDRVKDSIPTGRGGQHEEVARTILSLASSRLRSSLARSSTSLAAGEEQGAVPSLGAPRPPHTPLPHPRNRKRQLPLKKQLRPEILKTKREDSCLDRIVRPET